MILYSVPMISTWTFVEELRLLVDCGDGAAATLGGKLQKIDTIVLTHAHRDHIGGLMQVLNLRGGSGKLKVLHPTGSKSFSALSMFLTTFDEESSGKVEWIPLNTTDTYRLNSTTEIQPFVTNHMEHQRYAKSVGYRLTRTQDRLRPEYLDRGPEIPKIVKALGKEAVFSQETTCDYLFGGDGLPFDPAYLEGVKTMMLECTFLEHTPPMRDHVHASLPEVHRLVTVAKPERLILNHISARYSDSQIRDAVNALEWPCPVQVVFPGTVLRLG